MPIILRHSAEAAALRGALRAARALGPVAASNLGGAVARRLGPAFPVSRVADRNLRRAMPALDDAARRRVIRGVWDNLGRTAAELPHLTALRRTDSGPGFSFDADEELRELRARGGPALFFSAHIGNWEAVLPAAAALGLPVSGFYRAASNRLVDQLVQDLRQAATGPGARMFAKGAPGARAALLHLRGGGMLGMLTDQKMNDGIAADFFGRPAMTAPALAHYALRFRCPVIPIHTIRLGPARFHLAWDKPLEVPDTGDRAADALTLTRAMNATLERWITAHPESWLWLHRRWPATESEAMQGRAAGEIGGRASTVPR